MLETLVELWPNVTAIAAVVLTIVVLAMIVLSVRDDRAAIAWVGVVLLSPVLGAVAYLLLGVNRIRRRAQQLKRDHRECLVAHRSAHVALPPGAPGHIARLADLGARVVETPLVAGNRLVPLIDGDEAFSAMLAAIEGAQRSVALQSYIFRNDEVGARFIDALADAAARGVTVRVLIDGLGSHYTWPTVIGPLSRRGVTVARFLHSFWPWQMPYLNLRSHRKLLVVDATTGFTGGINITSASLFGEGRRGHAHDTHFEVAGPVVTQLLNVFAQDWSFTTGETLDGEAWIAEPAASGPVAARAIASGPDRDLERLRWVLLGAISQAQSRIAIMTPYFLPDSTLATALLVAAMRGVTVDVVIPAHSNLPYVDWAAWPRFGEMVAAGCRLWLGAGAFDHSKLMAIDGAWALIGSANWDPRSLRLNFELDVECYDGELAGRIAAMIDRRLPDAVRVTHELVAHRGLPVRLRDGVARLFSPYL